MRVRSIKSQLLLWLLLPLLLLSSVKLFVSHTFAAHRSQEIYDEILRNSADSIVARIEESSEGKVTLDFPEFAQALFRHNEKDRFWYKISSTEGNFLLGDEIVPSLKRPDNLHVLFADGSIEMTKVRIISLPYRLPTGTALLIEIAETCNARESMDEQVLATQIWLQLAVITGGALFVWLGVHRGLAPLTEIQKAMAARSPTDLRPLEIDNPPSEVAPLVAANNRLLQELKAHLDSQTEFASNAAHQLRTPLTGLKTYVSLGARLSQGEKLNEVFAQLNAGLNRMTQLVNRLLSLARVEKRAASLSLDAVVDLNLLVGESVSELLGSTIEKSIDLQFVPSLSPAFIHADNESIRELIDNIVHNAVSYTPKGGVIKVSILAEQEVVFIVEDSGPGIPPNERERVFDRFYRMTGSQGEGSGLGLSIVKEIAATHRAQVTIGEGKAGTGCKISVAFPRREIGARAGSTVGSMQ